tara:strand:- start:155 stop:1087 length:933 start_codon:yes stop_codon:yes gene_type:complete
MVNYICPRCGYNINNITKYQKHLSRKKLCENKISDDNLIDEYMKYNITEKLQNNDLIDSQQKVNIKSTLFKNSQHLVNKKSTLCQQIYENSYICEYCEKQFNFKQSYYRHMKTCKIKKEIDSEENEMNKIVEMLNEQLKDKDKKIDELIKKSGNTTTINYQQNQSINNNFKLLGYRNTDISHLSDKDFISCISHSNFCIPHLIKKIHFDPEKPENHNIYISNIKNNYAMTYDGDKWNLSNRDDLINDILEEKEIIIEEKLEEWLEKGKQYPEIMKKFTRYLEKKEHDVVLDKIKDEIKLVLFNNRNLIKN